MGTKIIVSVDQNAELIPARAPSPLQNEYEAADFIHDRADSIAYVNDQNLLHNALADAIWNLYGRDGTALDSLDL